MLATPAKQGTKLKQGLYKGQEQLLKHSRPPFVRWVALSMVLIAGFALIACSSSADAVSNRERREVSKPVGPRVGYHAPDFSLSNLQGQQVRFADLRGKPVLLNFWATWCPSCRDELPAVEAIAREYGGSVVVLGVSVEEQPGTVAQFAKRMGLSLNILVDPDGTTAEAYNVFGLPTAYFIDKGGIIRSINVGPMGRDAFAEQISLLTSQ